MKRHRLNTLRFMVIAAVLICALSLSYMRWRDRTAPVPSLPEPPDSSGEWLTYADNRNGFEIPYPANLSPITLERSAAADSDPSLPDDGVSFSTLGPGTMGVKIYVDPPFSSLVEWLAFENSGRANLREEGYITIDGQTALVTHYMSGPPDYSEEFPGEKRTVFLKDGNLFEIWTKFYTGKEFHERVWKGFHFAK